MTQSMVAIRARLLSGYAVLTRSCGILNRNPSAWMAGLVWCALALPEARAEDYELFVLNTEQLHSIESKVQPSEYEDFTASLKNITIEDQKLYLFEPGKIEGGKSRSEIEKAVESACTYCSVTVNSEKNSDIELPPVSGIPKKRWCIDPKTGEAYRCKDEDK